MGKLCIQSVSSIVTAGSFTRYLNESANSVIHWQTVVHGVIPNYRFCHRYKHNSDNINIIILLYTQFILKLHDLAIIEINENFMKICQWRRYNKEGRKSFLCIHVLRHWFQSMYSHKANCHHRSKMFSIWSLKFKSIDFNNQCALLSISYVDNLTISSEYGTIKKPLCRFGCDTTCDLILRVIDIDWR